VRGSASSTPSTTFSSRAFSAVSGVRSSCDAFAISSRRNRSVSSSCLGHRVERARQLADLVRRRRVDPLPVVAAGHRGGRGRHLAQRPGHAAREQLRQNERDDEADRQAHQARQPEHAARERVADDPGQRRQHDHDAELRLQRPDPGQRPHPGTSPRL
jgi:hypothetical protein